MSTHPLDPEMSAEQYAARDVRYASYTHYNLKRDACAELLKRRESIRNSESALKIISGFGLNPEDVYQVTKERRTWRIEKTYKHYVAAMLKDGKPVRVDTVKALGLLGVDNHQVINNCYVKPT